MNNRYVYHYHLSYRRDSDQCHFDGIAQLEKRITCIDGYTSMKEMMVKSLAIEVHHTKVIIESLSFIGMERAESLIGNIHEQGE